MNAKSLLIGTVVGTVVLFVMGYLIYEVVLGSVYQQGMAGMPVREDPDMMLVTLSTVVYAFFVTFVFVKWAMIRTAVAGAAAGAILGFLVTLSVDLGMAAMMTGMTTNLLLVDVLAATVWTGLGGTAIGYALARTAPPAVPPVTTVSTPAVPG